MSSSLELDQATMERLGRQVVEYVAAHLAGLRDQRVFKRLPRSEAERLIGSTAPREGKPFEELMAFLDQRVLRWHTPEPHPGFLAYVQGCPVYPAILGDWLAAGHNIFAGAWHVASGPAMLELTVLDWFREWLGMPPGSGGLLTSGGSSANLMAMVAARHRVVGEDASLLPKLTVYCSDQTHSSVTRAAWMAGVPRAQVRILPADGDFRLSPPQLEAAIAADRASGLVPLAIVASGGTTNTGAVDPLPALAELAQREDIWLHVDGAFGGFAVLSETGREALQGIGLADSVTLDPHKWLYMPFECGSLMVREPARLRDAFHILPDYLRDMDPGEVNFADYGEQLTRSAKALKVWLGVSYYGSDRLGDAIEAGIRRAELAERLIRETRGLAVLSPAHLSVCCFRAESGPPESFDRLNQRILERINDGGRFFLSTTRVRGALALRICCCGWRTTDDDIRTLIRDIAEAAPVSSR